MIFELDAARVALVGIVAFAFAVEAALGFGATVVTVALASFFLPLDTILPALVPVNLCLSASLVVRTRRFVAWRFLLRDVIGFIALGIPVGLALYGRVEERWLKLAFGMVVVLLGIVQLSAIRRDTAIGAAGAAPERRSDRTVHTPEGTSAKGRVLLFVAGVIHGAFATGGPLIVYVLGRRFESDKAGFRATLSVLWLVFNLVLLTTYALSSRLSGKTFGLSAALAIGMIAGAIAGEIAFNRVSPQRFRVFVFAMLIIAGLVLVARNVVG